MDAGERALALAALLAAWPVRFAVAGGTARWACGRGEPPRDLDIVTGTEPGNLRALAAALAEIGGLRPPTARTLARGEPCRVLTSFCPLDVFTAAAPPVRRYVSHLGVRIGVADA